MANALSVQAKTITEPETMPGRDSGRVTRRNTRAGLAPRLAAARSYTGSMWLIAAASSRIMVGIEKCTSPTSTPRGVNSIGTGQVTTVLPRTSTHAYVRTIAPVKNGASTSTRSAERTRAECVRASA